MLPFSVEAAEKAARKIDADAIRARQPSNENNQFIAKDGRTEEQQLTELLNHTRNQMANHLATEGCIKCAKTFVRGFTSEGPNPEGFCRRGMDMLIKMALVTETLIGEPVTPPALEDSPL